MLRQRRGREISELRSRNDVETGPQRPQRGALSTQSTDTERESEKESEGKIYLYMK